MNFIVKITILWRKKNWDSWDSYLAYVANKGYLVSSGNVFLQYTAKLLYFSLASMFKQTHTKEIFVKELFKLRNCTFIKSWDPLTFWHSNKTTQCSIRSQEVTKKFLRNIGHSVL